MKREIRIQSQNKEETQAAQQSELASGAVREFATPEEMIRHDALHTPVPPRLHARLSDSIGRSPPAKQVPWWRKLLGGS